MRKTSRAIGVIVGICLLMAPAIASAQSSSGDVWTVPRTPDGHPDLQGVWASDSATPLERPEELSDSPVLTDEEVATLQQRAAELFNGETDAAFGDSIFRAVLADETGYQSGDGVTAENPEGTGNYNQFWLIDRWFDNRTSLIEDPPDGRIPEMTPQGKQRAEARRAVTRPRFPTGPEDLGAGLRCTGGRVPMTGRGYNSNYQIVQSADTVAILMEMMHETRIIPIGQDVDVPADVRKNLGVSSGYWDGDTLVVETTNFKRDVNFSGASRELHLTERFTRLASDTLQYEFTMDDAATWTRPWTAKIVMRPAPGTGQIYEFACHEGNYAIANTLRGARLQEADKAGR